MKQMNSQENIKKKLKKKIKIKNKILAQNQILAKIIFLHHKTMYNRDKIIINPHNYPILIVQKN